MAMDKRSIAAFIEKIFFKDMTSATLDVDEFY